MQHRVIDKRPLIERPYFELEVELFPDTEMEKLAIHNCENFIATDAEKELIDNYLLFGINPSFSIVEVIEQRGNKFILKAAMV